MSRYQPGLATWPSLWRKLKTRTTERDALNRRLQALAEPPNRAKLKAALEQRCADWRERLRSDHIEEARYVLQQLLGPLELWFASSDEKKALG